jgi:hypothetical protein
MCVCEKVTVFVRVTICMLEGDCMCVTVCVSYCVCMCACVCE